MTRSGHRRALALLASADVARLDDSLKVGSYVVRVRRTFPGDRDQIAQALGPVPVSDEAVLTSELSTNADAPRGALLYPRYSREELKGGSWA
jgi:hypothetical protein